jgi:hypothetical protein
MMKEQLIVAAMLKDRKAYETFQRVGNESDFGPIGLLVTRAVGEYYECDPGAGDCSRDFIAERLLRDIKNPKHEGPLRDYIQGLPGDASGANVARELRELHKQKVGGRLSLALANGAAEEEIQKLLSDYQRGSEQVLPGPGPGALVDPLDTSDMTEEKGNVEYIQLWPKPLNDRLDGGALRGHHVLVFARPETGKTLFAINLTCGFLHQKLNVLYVGNEEPVQDVRDRVRGRLLKVPRSAIREDRSGALAGRLAKAPIGQLRIAADATSFAGVRGTLTSADPAFDVVILDQLRNMRVKSEGRTAELEAAGIEARAIAKDFNVLVVSITQAGDSASGKAFLEMSDVDSSKTGIPASADLMIGLGADDIMKSNGILGLSLPKNKLSGLHDKLTVTVNYSTGVLS